MVSVKRSEELISGSSGNIHCYFWIGRNKPNRVIILLHGLLMHGNVFETIATHLAKQDAFVVAPDLRGFGRTYFGAVDKRSIDYGGSLRDVSELVYWLHGKHPQLPMVLIGESLGAHLARNLAANCADVIDGVVLSNPCMKPRVISFDLVPAVLGQIAQVGLNQRLEADLTPFARKFLIDEPDNLKHYLDDPMCRKTIDVLELIESMLILGTIRPQSIPNNMSLLVYRGKNDGVCKSSSYNQFMSSLTSNNMTVVECQSCAHLILQSKKLCPDILKALDSWLETLTS